MAQIAANVRPAVESMRVERTDAGHCGRISVELAGAKSTIYVTTERDGPLDGVQVVKLLVERASEWFDERVARLSAQE